MCVLFPEAMCSHFAYSKQTSTMKYIERYIYLIQNSQAVKKKCGPYGEKRCEIQGGGQEMAVMVG